VVSAREAVADEPFTAAVRTAVCAAEIVPAVAVKVALEVDGGTATDAGAVSSGLLLDNATEMPADGAGPLKVRVHMLTPPEVIATGVQVKLSATTVLVIEASVLKTTSTQ
jgi:hypothetical protein